MFTVWWVCHLVSNPSAIHSFRSLGRKQSGLTCIARILAHVLVPVIEKLYVAEKEAGLKKIILSGYIDVPSDQIKLIKSALPKHIELTRKEDGCLVGLLSWIA